MAEDVPKNPGRGDLSIRTGIAYALPLSFLWRNDGMLRDGLTGET